MKKLIFTSIFAVIFGLTATFVSARKTTRIYFGKGAVSAVVSGTLMNYKSKKVFVIRVRAGQTLRTEQIGENYITVYIKSPSGEDVGDADASCNNRKEISPTVAGDYRIEVVECRKADAWRGRFKLKVTVD